METEDVEWSRVVSRFVRDEAYEGINAPKWADLSAPDAAAADDEAWFCRPDCRHPKTADDFLIRKPPIPKQSKLHRSASIGSPFAELIGSSPARDDNALKRRVPGACAAAASSPKGPARRKFQEDGENQDPNMATPPPAGRPPLGAAKWPRKLGKDPHKSSAERRPAEPDEAVAPPAAPQRQLKSTMSAGNLFSGKDILSQISEFCCELKRLALGSTAQPAPDVEQRTPLNPSPMKGKGVETPHGERRLPQPVLREVHAGPPTPQKFPPLGMLTHSRAAMPPAAAASSSPLRKPLKSPILKRRKEEQLKQPLMTLKDEEFIASSAAAAAAVPWFWKPCTQG